MPEASYERLNTLRDERRERPLISSEQAELDRLSQDADTLVLRKAYAAVLLTWRGQRLSSPAAHPDYSNGDA